MLWFDSYLWVRLGPPFQELPVISDEDHFSYVQSLSLHWILPQEFQSMWFSQFFKDMNFGFRILLHHNFPLSDVHVQRFEKGWPPKVYNILVAMVEGLLKLLHDLIEFLVWNTRPQYKLMQYFWGSSRMRSMHIPCIRHNDVIKWGSPSLPNQFLFPYSITKRTSLALWICGCSAQLRKLIVLLSCTLSPDSF